MNSHLLIQSLLLSGAVALLSLFVGLCAAIAMTVVRAPFRTLLILGGVATLVLPPFLLANAWLDIAAKGAAHGWQIPATGFLVTAFALTALYWPIPMFACSAAWHRLELPMLEADPLVRGRFLLLNVLLPLAGRFVAAAAALVFVLALNNFSVPAVLQTKTYPVEVWIRYTTALDAGAAFRTSLPMIVGPLLLLLLVSPRKVAWPHICGNASRELLSQRLGKWVQSIALGVALLAIALSVLFPIVTILFDASTWKALPGALAAGRGSLLHSVLYAGGASVLCGVVGISLAFWKGRGYPPCLSWILFLLPGTLIGILLAWVTSNGSLAFLRDSIAIVIFTLFVRHLAITWTTTRIAFDSADPALTDAARLEGASRWQLLRHVYWPQCSRQIIAGIYAVFLLCLWELDTALSLVPPGGDTLAMRAFNLLHYGHTAEVHAVCLILLAVALAPLLPGFLSVANRGRQRPGLRSLLLGAISGISLLAGCAQHDEGTAGQLIQSTLFERVEVIGTKGAGLGQFSKPRSVAVDRADNLYVADFTGRIQKFSPAGDFLFSWQMPQTDLGRPKGMCRDHEGNIVIVEPHYSRINHFDTNNLLVRQWGIHGTNGGQLAFPRAVAVTPHGEIFVSEYGLCERIQRFALGPVYSQEPPRLLSTFGVVGNQPGQFNRPEGLCLDSANTLYVADSCNHRIQIFDDAGTFQSQFGTAGTASGQLSYPYDVAVDKEGRRYVCEFGNSRIQIFDRDNRPLEIIGGPGASPGKLANPWSIALDSRGNLYVADSQNHRVQKWIRKG